jgi:hypothetical protein
LVLKGGVKAYIRLRVPKFLYMANGVTSIAKEVTVHILQLDEMAEVLRGDKTPAVISIGERCLEMGYAFYWPPFSEHPIFVKPDGARVTMEVEGNIPYLAGREIDNACPAEGADGPDADAEKTRTWKACLVARLPDAWSGRHLQNLHPPVSIIPASDRAEELSKTTHPQMRFDLL